METFVIEFSSIFRGAVKWPYRKRPVKRSCTAKHGMAFELGWHGNLRIPHFDNLTLSNRFRRRGWADRLPCETARHFRAGGLFLIILMASSVIGKRFQS